jgi:aminopeptidase N
MKTSFLQYVAEGRVVRRQSDLQRYTFQEITERIYLSFLTLTLLKNFSQTKNFVKSYSAQTLTYGSFDKVRGTANDLHNMLAIVAGNTEIVQKLANKNAAMALRQRQTVPVNSIKRYLKDFKDEYRFLTRLESGLGITNPDYKNLRRAISDFISLDGRRKKITATRLLQALKAKLPGTDLQRQAQTFADKSNLELDNVVDAERTVPGAELSPNEMQAYRLLVGAANVRRAKIAADMVKQGKAVPAPIMVAYAPIITMIDDIAKGGYTFVKLLQVIHARAKNKR